ANFRAAHPCAVSSTGRARAAMTSDNRKTPGQYLILSLLALPFLIFAGFMAYFGVRGTPMSALVHSGVYSEALTRARNDPRVRDALGSPVETDAPRLAVFEDDGATGQARFTILLRGPKAPGRLSTLASKRNGAWTFETLAVRLDGGREIDLRDRAQ
ncbi:MAG: cytochrome c oxidase assembly factor Coa1 family protein, partial [Acidobacteriota bacterium]